MRNYAYLSKNLSDIRRELSALEDVHGRKITLVAVTKSGSDEEFSALISLGVTDVGENRPGELARRGELAEALGKKPRLHQIGHLQRNKVKTVVGRADIIHSLDSLALAAEIDKQARKLGIIQDVLIEINSGREEQKGGVDPDCAEELFIALRQFSNLSVRGLMTMGPALDHPEEMRPYFILTKKIFDKLNTEYGFSGEPILSMGMSESYKVAIEEGANLVRVGRRLFMKENQNV
jgi:pyridoxal phosphate enzyme (YggS family)